MRGGRDLRGGLFACLSVLELAAWSRVGMGADYRALGWMLSLGATGRAADISGCAA